MNTSRFLIALGIILCLVLSPVIALMPANTAQAQPADSPWPMFRQNPQRTGRSTYSGPEVPKLKWSFNAGGWSSPAIGADGTIYVGSGHGSSIDAINPDGSQKWSFNTGYWVRSSPAIGADGTIYVGSDDYNLYAINPDGSQKWSFTTEDDVSSSPAIGADGTIYVGSDDYNLYAINPDGSQKWSFTTGDLVRSSPAIGADGTIYVGSYDNKLYAITEGCDLTISSTAGGSVTNPGEGTFTYDPGTGVNLLAEAEEGYRFINWTGDVDTIANVNAAETTITIDNNYEITANFKEIPSVNWTLIGVIIAVAIVAGVVIFFLLRRRRRAV